MTIVSAVIMLGILIFVHELGHFLFAKFMNVKVLKFSLGFGPKIIGRKIGETEYMISAVPLGGYVKMLGEDVGDDFSEAEKVRAFQFQSLSKRSIIVLAGPVFNILLTYIIYATSLSAGVPITVPNIDSLMPVVSSVVPDSPAFKAGIKRGDRVVRINGKDIDTQIEIMQLINENPEKELTLLIRRGDKLFEYKIVPEKTEIRNGDQIITIGRIGIEHYMSPVIGDVVYGSPAFEKGIQKGDRILRVNGRDIATWPEMVQIIRENPERAIDLTVQRGDDILDLQIVPDAVQIEEGNEKVTIGRIGVFQASFFETIRSETVYEAFYKGAIATYEMGFFIFDSIKVLIRGDVSFKNIGGPITIVRESGKAASAGLLAYLMFMAIISVNLGVLNLLPIPILDGGHLMFFLFERLKGGPLDERTVQIAQRIGFAIIIALMVVAFYNDIMRWITDN